MRKTKKCRKCKKDCYGNLCRKCYKSNNWNFQSPSRIKRIGDDEDERKKSL